jgi:hypothetical protein
MIARRLREILTYYDSEPTEVLQGLIWLVFFPIVLLSEMAGPVTYLVAPSMVIGLLAIYAAAKSCIKTRLYTSFAYGLLSLIATYVFISNGGLKVHATNWGWVVICISAISNIKRVRQKYLKEMSPSVIDRVLEEDEESEVEQTIERMYRDDMLKKIEELQRENIELRFKIADLQTKNEE